MSDLPPYAEVSSPLVASLQRLLTRTRDLTGDLRDCIAKTPEHRLYKLCLDVERDIKTVRDVDMTKDKEIFYVSALELSLHLDHIDLAKKELAGWDAVMRECRSPTYYDHFIFVRITLYIFRGWGWQAQMLPEHPQLKTPDLMVYRDGVPMLAAEVKTKAGLKDPVGKVPDDKAMAMVERAIEQSIKQLPPHLAGFLVIGSFFLDSAQLDDLRNTAVRWFGRHVGAHPSLSGILFINVLIYSASRDDPLNSVRIKARMEQANNPWYVGETEVISLYEPTVPIEGNGGRWQPTITMIAPGKTGQ